MTIEEIKYKAEMYGEGAVYSFEEIDTLLAEVERLNDCKGCDAPRQLAVATEALDKIEAQTGDVISAKIASTALERMKG